MLESPSRAFSSIRKRSCFAMIRMSLAVVRNARLALVKRAFAVCSIFQLFTQATGARFYTHIRYIYFFLRLDWPPYDNSFLSTLASVETIFIPSHPSFKLFVCYLPDSGRHVNSLCQGFSLGEKGPGNDVCLVVRWAGDYLWFLLCYYSISRYSFGQAMLAQLVRSLPSDHQVSSSIPA